MSKIRQFKEEERRKMCILSGIPYHTPLERWKIKTKDEVERCWFNFTHFIIGYLLWGLLMITPKKYQQHMFMTFQAWCFGHSRKGK